MPRATKDCETCGNPILVAAHTCRFCGSVQTGSVSDMRVEPVRTIDLEAGRPAVEEALRRLDMKLSLAIQESVRVVRVIHGYGSTGRGGAIRDAARRALAGMLARKQIVGMIRGEDHAATRLASRDILRRVPSLKSTTRTDCDNPGITLVEI